MLVETHPGRYEVAVPGVGDVLVEAAAISPLLDFERSSSDSSPAEARLRGNALFGLSDFAAAHDLYLRGFELLTRGPPLSVGTAVLVELPEDPYNFCSGVLFDVRESTCSVLLDGDEERQADMSRLLSIGQDGSEERELVRALSMNLGRSCLKLSRKAWAVRWFSIAHAVISASEDESPDKCKRLADALCGRASSYLELGKLRLAKKDITALLAVDETRGARLAREWEDRRRTRGRQDRALAREVARWVETAVATSEQLQVGHQDASSSTLVAVPSSQDSGDLHSERQDEGSGCAVT